MLDKRIHIFVSVATRLSFSRAANELHITQPAVTRHIKQLEDHFNQKLFNRKGNSISLTTAGNLLLQHSKEILALHRQLQFNMNALIDKTEGQLRVAASTTIAQYILPEALSKFRKKYPKINVALANANTAQVEQLIIDGMAELGFIEGKSKNIELAYHNFIQDEIVLVVAKGHPLYNVPAISLQQLKQTPLILREKGSGTLEFILTTLNAAHIKEQDLLIEMHLGSSESIKSYIKDRSSAAFVSINTVVDELASGALGIVDIEGFEINRTFNYVYKQGHHSPLSDVFLQFLNHHYKIML